MIWFNPNDISTVHVWSGLHIYLCKGAHSFLQIMHKTEYDLTCFQVMLLGSSQQLLSPVLVIEFTLNALSEEILMGWPSGEWVVVVEVVPSFIADHIPHLLVGLAMFSQSGLEMQMTICSSQCWVALQPLNWMAHWLSALDQLFQGPELEAVLFKL